jgi:hypothetical protein
MNDDAVYTRKKLAHFVPDVVLGIPNWNMKWSGL